MFGYDDKGWFRIPESALNRYYIQPYCRMTTKRVYGCYTDKRKNESLF
ncbi:hypothetical protein HMPREF1990_01148 [Porphyromonas gingivalis W4087]|nr:hypothetical protein HMPREF1990_01148 [Porphyromonas gingivalis W4087]